MSVFSLTLLWVWSGEELYNLATALLLIFVYPNILSMNSFNNTPARKSEQHNMLSVNAGQRTAWLTDLHFVHKVDHVEYDNNTLWRGQEREELHKIKCLKSM